MQDVKLLIQILDEKNESFATLFYTNAILYTLGKIIIAVSYFSYAVLDQRRFLFHAL